MDTIRSVDDLVGMVAKGKRPKYVFFWGHTGETDRITTACLSQWWPSPFEVEGYRYLSAEYFMMASKARLFDDTATLQRILASKHPKQAKELGRQVAGFNEQIWAQRRFDLVVTGNLAKFSQAAPLREFLLNTKDKVLVEASPYDRIWGIGLAADNERAVKPDRWRGLNLLGFALMRVRHMLSSP